MAYGYNNRILRVNLSDGDISVHEPGGDFYRRYMGGRAFVAHYLLKELNPGIDPLGPDNKLIFAASVVTGASIGGSGRNSVGAKSPLTGGYGDAEIGGFWGAELKRAGYDAIIVEGHAKTPVYLWIHEGEVEIRPADHLWGCLTAEVETIIREELGEKSLRVAQCGLAGEQLVRYACVVNDLRHFAGRTGLGAVMGSKRLRAVAVKGAQPPDTANPNRLRELRQWLSENDEALVAGFRDVGTPGFIPHLNSSGGLPTRNFQSGHIETADKISGQTLRDTLLTDRGTCFACPVRCKRIVEIKTDPWEVNPAYGGPEYESIAALGSCCGVSDLAAICKANELCAAFGLDTISTGVSIAFAMECYERGLLTSQESDGLELTFGNAQAMVQLVEMIAHRQGLGAILAEGVRRAAARIGHGSEAYALEIKGQEIPLHEPRFKPGMGLGYAVSTTGADHSHNIHDDFYVKAGQGRLKAAERLGLWEPLSRSDLSPTKVRLFMYESTWRNTLNCLDLCQFLPWDHNQVADIVESITGWKTSAWELMKVGERATTMTRAFNAREGFSVREDYLPRRFFEPLPDGALAGVALDEETLEASILTYYHMMGWDPSTGRPTLAKLQELDIGWVQEVMDEV